MQGMAPKHIVAVSALVRNHQGGVLLVKTHLRADTWELPGGQVEEGEPPDRAVVREVREETGIQIRPSGVTGVYYNASQAVLSIVFIGEYLGGTLHLQPEEIQAADFVALTPANMAVYITRPPMRSRTQDALMGARTIPYEAWKIHPFDRLIRLE